MMAGCRIALVAMVMLFVFSGCAKKMAVPPAPAPVAAGAGYDKISESGRLFVRSASVELRVDNVGNSLALIIPYVEKQGGFVEKKNVSGDKEARMVIRVPSESLASAVDGLAAFGKLLRRNISSAEVTGQYIDLEARLKNSIALRDRLTALLTRAANVEDILGIERELARLQGDIDSLEGRMKSLKGRIDYAAVDLHLKRKWVLGPLGYTAAGLGWVIRKLFVLN